MIPKKKLLVVRKRTLVDTADAIRDVGDKTNLIRVTNLDDEILDLEVDKYVGVYEVIPDTTTQVLETSNTRVNHNITIKPIPFTRVSNTSGGDTVIIGEPTD